MDWIGLDWIGQERTGLDAWSSLECGSARLPRKRKLDEIGMEGSESEGIGMEWTGPDRIGRLAKVENNILARLPRKRKWSGLDWKGLDRTGADWTGPDRIGLGA
jgi:hypothetical protein